VLEKLKVAVLKKACKMNVHLVEVCLRPLLVSFTKIMYKKVASDLYLTFAMLKFPMQFVIHCIIFIHQSLHMNALI